MSTVVIANPSARGGWVGAEWARLTGVIRDQLGTVEFRRTARMGDGVSLAEQAIRDGATRLVSLGGDGTHGEVARGILAAGAGERVSLGVLHAGTGGDFRRLLERGEDLRAACRVIADTDPVAIDAGEVTFDAEGGGRETRHFLNIASMGMSGLVDRNVAASSKRLGGTATYFLASLRAFLAYAPATVEVKVDGERLGEFRINTVAVCNGQYFGSGMRVAPEARLADGLLDVVVLAHAPLVDSLAVAKAIYAGAHLGLPHVHTARGREIEVTPRTDARATMDIDGEAPGTAPASCRVLPGALRVHGVAARYR